MISITIIYMSVMSRLSGSGFGQKWGVPWLPELLFSLAFGLANSYAWHVFGFHYAVVTAALFVSTAISYGAMQSGTWMFLRWESHDDPNMERKSTLKPIVDFIAKPFGYKLGEEGYAWISTALKGFLIGLPVGGLPLAILWPLGYEIGSHAKGRTEKWVDPHTVPELAAGVGAGIAVVLFVVAINRFTGA